MKNTNTKQSEFGKGLVICLVKFSQHIHQNNFLGKIKLYKKWIDETKENRELMLSKNPPSNLNFGFPHMQELKYFVEIADKIHKGDYEESLSHEIELWMNGASDHLYEIEVPEGKDWDKIRKKVNSLREKGLDMGHGFRSLRGIDTNKWTFEDVIGLFQLAEEIAVMIDKKLGLKSDIGQW